MEHRVILDASHGGTDPGLVYQGRQEKDDTLKLTMAVGAKLHERAVDVVYTRLTDIYHTPFERVEMANNSGADLLISIHRRAMRGESDSLGVQHVVYENKGIPAILSKNISEKLSELGYLDLGTIEKPSLVLLRRSKMPAVMTEVGFIDNDDNNRFFDEHLDQIAEKITDGIVTTLAREEFAPQAVYRVQTGAYENSERSDQQLMQLRNQAFPAVSFYEDGYYKVQVGAYSKLEDAADVEAILRMQGYNTFIATL